MQPARPIRNPLQNPLLNGVQNPYKTTTQPMCYQTPLYPPWFGTPPKGGGHHNHAWQSSWGRVGRSAYYGGCPCRSVADGQSPTSSAESRQDPLSGHRCAIPCRAAERWHQTMKNRGLPENYFLPGDLERQIGAFVEHYNNHRYHESLNNLSPADVYHGRSADILKMKEEIKKQTIRKRRLQHQAAAA